MGNQLASMSVPLPASTGGLVLPGAGANAAAPAPMAGDDPAVVAALQNTLVIVQQLVAAVSAQQAAAGVQGGGALAAPLASPALGGASSLAGGGGIAISASTIGGGFFASPVVDTSGPTPVVGGGGSSLGVPHGSSPAPRVATTSAAPAPATPVAGGGAATPQVDMRRVAGTPQPGGVIDTIIRGARSEAPPALGEGEYIEVADGAGARMQVHVHGAWRYHPHQVAEGIRQGFLAPHVHPDGTVHLHDVRA